MPVSKKSVKTTDNKVKQPLSGRFIIAIDRAGAHISKTEFVVHHGESGKVSYDAIPMYTIKNKPLIKKLIQLIEAYD
jgi:hypothetical protein